MGRDRIYSRESTRSSWRRGRPRWPMPRPPGGQPVYAHHFPKGDRQFIERMAQIRAAATPTPTLAADAATIPLTLQPLADLNTRSWPRDVTPPGQPAQGVEIGAPGGERA